MSTPRTRRLALAGTAALAAIALLASCAGQSAGTDDADAGDPVTGGTLTYLEHQTYTNLYPPQAGFYPNGGLVNNIAARLTWQNPETLEIEPWIATDWTVNADATEYTFNLRDDVTFSDGTAARRRGRREELRRLRPRQRGARAHDLGGDQQLRRQRGRGRGHRDVPLLGAGAGLPAGDLDDQLRPALAGHARPLARGLRRGQRDRDHRLRPVRHHRGEARHRAHLEAREDYDWAPPSFEHQGRAYLDDIHLIVTPEDSVRIGSLLSGQADYIRYVQAFDEARVDSAGFELYAPQTRGVNNALSLRFTNPLLSDIRVRQALVHGVDAQEVVDTIFTANYPVATSELAATASATRTSRSSSRTTRRSPSRCSTKPAGRSGPTASARRTASASR